MPDTSARIRPGDIVRIRDARWRVVRGLKIGGVDVIDASGWDASNRAARARFLLPFERVDRLPCFVRPRVVPASHWRHVARRTLAHATASPAALRSAARADFALMPFQLEPALAVTRGDACRLLIADAVGLGKTVQAALIVAEILHRRPDARVLIIAPASLRDQWRDELRNRFRLHGEVLDSAGIAGMADRLPPEVNPWSVAGTAITSIDYVKRPEVIRALEPHIWDLLIMDEAHHLATRSDRSAAASALAARARTVVLLSATPHSGDDEAFGRLSGIGNISDGYPLMVFRRSRADVGLPSASRAVLMRVRVTPAEAAVHAALMAYARRGWRHAAGDHNAGVRLLMSVLARRACSSAGSLLHSLERRLALLHNAGGGAETQMSLPLADPGADDGAPDALLGSPGFGDAGEERKELEQLIDLARRATAAESKLAFLRRLLRRISEPAIIFTEYRDTLQRVAAAVGELAAVQLHGGLTSRERIESLSRFTHGEARVLLATDAASEGLNLHHRCRLVINLELPWTPQRLDQRAGRVDRIGQARRIHAIHLVAATTCEEVTLARLVRRIDRIRSAVGFSGVFPDVPDDRRVAESAIAHAPLPDVDKRRAPAVAATVPVHLAEHARTETERLRLARTWLARSEQDAGAGRPIVARLRPRRGDRRGRGRCFWTFRLVISDGTGDVVWESVLPLCAALARPLERTPHAIRALANVDRIRDSVRAGATAVLEKSARSFRPAVALWSRREHDLAAAMRTRHARLSAHLAQGALFTRRNERIAAAQSTLLAEALRRSAARLDELAAYERLSADARELVFAVIVD